MGSRSSGTEKLKREMPVSKPSQFELAFDGALVTIQVTVDKSGQPSSLDAAALCRRLKPGSELGSPWDPLTRAAQWDGPGVNVPHCLRVASTIPARTS
jgi:hypothetical protein